MLRVPLTWGCVMRLIVSATLLVAVLPAFAQENEAEKLFRSMEKKICAAKALKLVVTADVEFNAKPAKFKVTGHFAEGNKSRIEAEFNLDGTPMTRLFVSDGKQTLLRVPPPVPQTVPQPTKAKQNETMIAAIARAGLLASFKVAEMRDLVQIDKLMPLSDFKLGAKELVGAAEAQCIDYVLTFNGQEKTNMKVWIDTKTLLPLKRTLRSEGKKDTFTENITDFVLDPKLDEKVFELPK